MKKSFDYIVYLKDTKEPIGNITFDRYNHSKNSLEISCYIHPNYWRKGYTSEALIEIMKFLFSQGYENILCGYDEGNVKSKTLGEKLGFEIYHVKENAWVKNGIPITTYTSILSKDKFIELYQNKQK